MSQSRGYRPGGFLTAALIGLLAAAPAPAEPIRTNTGDPPGKSLKWVPEDAALYASWLRTGEQLKAIAKSKAWAKLRELPAVQAVWKHVEEELTGEEGSLAFLYKFFQDADNKALIDLLGDMFAQEVFAYGGTDLPAVIELAKEFHPANLKIHGLLLRLAGRGRDLNPKQFVFLALMNILAHSADQIKIPDLIIGFKLSKTGPAKTELKRLEKLVNGLVKQCPRSRTASSGRKSRAGNS
jgi:hypothetical protein